MSNLKQVLRENTLRLLAAEGRMKSNETGISRLVAKGIGQGTAQRILEGKTSIGHETLEQLAGVLGVSPWRLILPMSNGESAEEASRIEGPKQPSAASLKAALMLDSLSAVERAAIRTILKKMGSVATSEAQAKLGGTSRRAR